MSSLLNKRLARSLWRTKLRLFAVIFMVSVGVFAGLTFGGYSYNLDGMYETIHRDDTTGANLADLWIDNRSTTWSAEEVTEFCDELASTWNNDDFRMDSCEGRNIVPGAMFYNNNNDERIINSLWHGISPDANSNRIWMPDGHSDGRLAVTADEIVIDAHVIEPLDLGIGDIITMCRCCKCRVYHCGIWIPSSTHIHGTGGILVPT